jgi:GT2 family glycosyltransferase
MKQLTSSVIICTRNRQTDLNNCLESIKCQNQQPNQLIIIDSSDNAVDQYDSFKNLFNQMQFPNTQLLYQHTTPGLTFQRNIGISLATKDIIYFFDDDTMLEPNYLFEMNAIFAQYPEYAGGMGTITNISVKQNNIYRWIRYFFLLQRDYASGRFTLSGFPTHAYGLTLFQKVEVLGGCCMAFRAQVLAKHKFDEQLTRYAYMEDCDISRRIAYEAPLFYNPKARLQHFASPLSRDAIIDNRAMFIKNYSYLFFKNFYPRNRLKIFAYSWSILGLFSEAILIRNKDYLKGYIQGMKEYFL